jgi:hypothetical protein
MAIFLAAIANCNTELSPDLSKRFRSVLSPAGNAETIQNGRIATAYIDLNIWPEPSVVSQGTLVAIVAGDPLVCINNTAHSREDSIKSIISNNDLSLTAIIRNAEGTYCCLVIDTKAQRLVAFTDKLGVRPIYSSTVKEVTYISNALWALEALADIPKTPNWAAATEVAAFGYPLSDKTLYKEVRTFSAGEITCIDKGGICSSKYWNWGDHSSKKLTGENPLEVVRNSFQTAVRDRIQNQNRVAAFLSGGMDSRLIVTFLREAGINVNTINFAPEGSQDLVLGKMASDALKTKHFEYPNGHSDFLNRLSESLIAWRESLTAEFRPERPNLFWSGDGGSVGLGHVYLTQKLINVSRTSNSENTAHILMQENCIGVTRRLFNEKWQHLAEHPLKAITEDLDSRINIEPGRNCHLFFMLNDQRRHLFQHFEKIHINKIDMILPFFDGRFIKAIVSSDVDHFIEHKLYNELMRTLPFNVGDIPWQAYPGHIPCPIPVPANLRQQWIDGWHDANTTRMEIRNFAMKTLKKSLSSSFPADVICRINLIIACLAILGGRPQYEYLLKYSTHFINACRFS